jgi:hypothetical protein
VKTQQLYVLHYTMIDGTQGHSHPMNLENAKKMQTLMERDGLFEEIGGQPQCFPPDSFSKIEILPVGPDADQ